MRDPLSKQIKEIKPSGIRKFFDIVDELETKLEAKKNSTNLPESPDMKKIEQFVMRVNEKVVRGDINCKYSVN